MADEDDDKFVAVLHGEACRVLPVRGQTAQRQLSEERSKLMHLPTAVTAMPSTIAKALIVQRAITTAKRKPVRFHNSLLLVIEPNLRVPIMSLRRSAAQAKETGPGTAASLLKACDSMLLGVAGSTGRHRVYYRAIGLLESGC